MPVMRRIRRRRVTPLRSLATVAVLVLVAGAGYVVWVGERAWSAWNDVQRVDFDLDAARSALGTAVTSPGAPEEPPPGAGAGPEAGTGDVDPAGELLDEAYRTVLVVGTDYSPDDPEIAAGRPIHADALLLYLAPVDGDPPTLVSLPRDLLVVDPCTGAETKLDRTLGPCGEDVSGPEHVALTVEDFTGVAVDHFAVLGFDAFVRAIDALGGVTICVDRALREGDEDLLPAGCSKVDGAKALSWIRSRKTKELVDGAWRFVDQTGDLARTRRQQKLLLALLSELRSLRSPAALASIAGEVGDAMTLDDSLSLSDAISMAWSLRSFPSSEFRRLELPVEPTTMPDGAFAYRATAPLLDVLRSG